MIINFKPYTILPTIFLMARHNHFRIFQQEIQQVINIEIKWIIWSLQSL